MFNLCIHNTFAFFDWDHIHVTISLFKVTDTSGRSTRFDLNEKKLLHEKWKV